MTEPANDALRRRAAAAAASRPRFLAAALARFRAAEALDEADLARWLGIAPAQLPRLALCTLPRPDRFRADVEAIAGRFGIEPARLANLLREVDALAALDAADVASGAGLLAAARAREDDAVYDAPAPEDDEP